MLISIIIPNLNNAQRLKASLASLEKEKGNLQPNQVEVVVVDNGSRDGSRKVAVMYNATLIVEERLRSPYLCRNRGILASKGKYIVLLDSNCVPKKGWLKAGIERLESDGNTSILTGPVEFEFSKEPSVAERFDYLYSVVDALDIPHRTALPATHLFIKRSVFEHIGLFISNVRSLGDIEWTRRAVTAGFNLGYCEAAKVSYPAKNWKAFFRKMFRLGRGTKEIWKATGKNLHSLSWYRMVIKTLLPPSPKFVKLMKSINRREGQRLSLLNLFLMCWLTKFLRGLGMILGKTLPEVHLESNAVKA